MSRRKIGDRLLWIALIALTCGAWVLLTGLERGSLSILLLTLPFFLLASAMLLIKRLF